MATYQDYLNFDSDEDKQKQLALFNQTELSESAKHAVLTINEPQQWLVAAAPYCPDCRVFVPLLQKMAELNPNISLNFVARSQFDDRSCFESDEQQQKVKDTQKIPSLFRTRNHQTEVFFSEFPRVVKEAMQADESRYESLRDAYRAGEFNAQMEEELLAILTA